MKKQMVVLAIFVAAIAAVHSQSPSYQPKNGFVPNAETAVRVAEAVLIPVYGEKQILSERPFKATLKRDVWRVDGTLHCGGPDVECAGGTAEVRISKSSGQILQMAHYK